MAFKQNPHFSKIWHSDFVSLWICDKMMVTVNFGIPRKEILKISSEVGTNLWDQNGGFLYTFKQCEKMWLHCHVVTHLKELFSIFQTSRPRSEAAFLIRDVPISCASFVVIKLWLQTLFVKISWFIHKNNICHLLCLGLGPHKSVDN